MAAIVASYRDQLANLENLKKGLFTPALDTLAQREAEDRKLAQQAKQFALEQDYANRRFDKELSARAEQRKLEREQERLFLQQDKDQQLLEGAMFAQQAGTLPKDIYIPTLEEGITPTERAYFTNAIQEANALRSPEQIELRARLIPLQQEASQTFARDPFNNAPAPVTYGPVTPTSMSSILEFEKRRDETQEAKKLNQQYARSLMPTVASDPDISRIVLDVANTGRNFTPEESQKIQQTQRSYRVLTEVEDAAGRDLIQNASEVGISIPSDIMSQGVGGVSSYIKEEASKELDRVETVLNDNLRNLVKLDEKRMEDLSKAITKAQIDLETKALDQGGKDAAPTQTEIDAATKAAIASVPGMNETVAATLNGVVASYLKQALTLSRLTGRRVNIRPDVLGLAPAPEDKPVGSGLMTQSQLDEVNRSPDKLNVLNTLARRLGWTPEQLNQAKVDAGLVTTTPSTLGVQTEIAPTVETKAPPQDTAPKPLTLEQGAIRNRRMIDESENFKLSDPNLRVYQQAQATDLGRELGRDLEEFAYSPLTRSPEWIALHLDELIQKTDPRYWRQASLGNPEIANRYAYNEMFFVKDNAQDLFDEVFYRVRRRPPGDVEREDAVNAMIDVVNKNNLGSLVPPQLLEEAGLVRVGQKIGYPSSDNNVAPPLPLQQSQ
jgi:hypothetical protein